MRLKNIQMQIMNIISQPTLGYISVPCHSVKQSICQVTSTTKASFISSILFFKRVINGDTDP